MRHGGGDLCLEMKAYNDLVAASSSSEYETTHRGDTHGFGNSEERLILAGYAASRRAGWQATRDGIPRRAAGL
jgi:hypothetical protein